MQLSSSTVYRDRVGYHKLSPQNQLNIDFVTSRQYRLGIAKPQNVFSNPFQNFATEF